MGRDPAVWSSPPEPQDGPARHHGGCGPLRESPRSVSRPSSLRGVQGEPGLAFTRFPGTGTGQMRAILGLALLPSREPWAYSQARSACWGPRRRAAAGAVAGAKRQTESRGWGSGRGPGGLRRAPGSRNPGGPGGSAPWGPRRQRAWPLGLSRRPRLRAVWCCGSPSQRGTTF